MGSADFLHSLSDEDRGVLLALVEKKAWVQASQVAEFTGKEHKAIQRAKREGGDKLMRRVQDRLYRRHHWDSLRWFLFGGLVSIPGLASDPTRAYDPQTNPYIKIRQPGFVLTVDEHDEANPTKQLPDKDYLRLLAYSWVHRDLLLVPKSRQLMVSWLFCSIALHNLIARNSQRMGFISKKEEDADALISRVHTIWKSLPHERLYVPTMRRVNGQGTCAETDSGIYAMNQEAKGLRSYTWSWLFSDEMAFQEQADSSLTAAMAAIKGGGRMTGVSTPDGEETFYSLVTAGGRVPVVSGR